MASLYRQRYTKKIPKGAEILTVNGEKKVKVAGKGGRVRMYDYVIGQDGEPRIYVPNGMMHIIKKRIHLNGLLKKLENFLLNNL